MRVTFLLALGCGTLLLRAEGKWDLMPSVALTFNKGLAYQDGHLYSGDLTQTRGGKKFGVTTYHEGQFTHYLEWNDRGEKIQERWVEQAGLRFARYYPNGQKMYEGMDRKDGAKSETKYWEMNGHPRILGGPPPVAIAWGFTWRSDPKRLVVAKVSPTSPAAEGKFQADDVILKVEGIAVATAKAFEERVGSFESGQRLKVQVERGGATLDLWLVKPSGSSAAGTPPSPLPQVPGAGQAIYGDPEVRKMIEKFYGAEWADHEIISLDFYAKAPSRSGPQAPYYIVHVKEKTAPATVYREIKVDARTGKIEAER